MKPKLFFTDPRRRPHFIPGIPNPENVEAYRNLNDEALTEKANECDFFTTNDFDQTSSPAVFVDIQDLTHSLLPLFLFADQRAKHYQNEYYKFQWVLFFSSLTTAVIGAITIYVGTATTRTVWIFTSAQWLGIASILAGAAISLITGRDRRRNSQKTWYLWRRVAEDLRKDYFLYLAHIPPYDGMDCLEVLQAKILQSRQRAERTEGNFNTDATTSPEGLTGTSSLMQRDTQAVKWPHTDEELKLFLNLYRKKRLTAQGHWYNDRIAEYRHNSEWVFDFGLLLAISTSVIAVINTLLGVVALFSLCVTLLPVLAAYIVSFERIYVWDRQSTLYFSARQRLEQHDFILAKRLRDPKQGYWEVVRSVVRDVEDTFTDEVTQWGSKVDQSSRTAVSSQDIIQDELNKLNLSQSQKDQIFSILRTESAPEDGEENDSGARRNQPTRSSTRGAPARDEGALA